MQSRDGVDTNVQLSKLAATEVPDPYALTDPSLHAGEAPASNLTILLNAPSLTSSNPPRLHTFFTNMGAAAQDP